MHGRTRVGLGEHEQLRFPGLRPDLRRERGERARHVLVGPKDAEPAAGDRAQHVLAVPHLEGVLAIPEEGEVVVGQPAQQLERLGYLGVVDAGRRRGGQLVGDPHGGVAQLRPVLDGLADVAQHALQRRLDLRELVGVGLPVDLHVDPGLGDELVVIGAARRQVGDLDEVAGDSAAQHELRVHDEVDRPALQVELGGYRVDQEGHVVGDDLDDGVPRGPALLLDGRGERPDPRRALRSRGREGLVRQRGAGDVDRVPADELLGCDVPVVALEEGCPVGVDRVTNLGGALQEVVLGFVEACLLHGHQPMWG